MTLRARVLAILEPDQPKGWALLFDLGMQALILANVLAIVIETVPTIGPRYAREFQVFEFASVAIFALEYAARLWACTADPRWAEPVRGRLRYAARPLVVIDLLAILPAILQFAPSARLLRAVRLLRLLRIFKLTRHSQALQTFGRVLRRCGPELASTLFALILLLVFASSLMYFLERDANPAFSSIPAAMWWGIATFTTVGYGDITPITTAGRVLGGAVAILGIGMFAIPAGVIGAAFMAEWQSDERRGRREAERDD